MNLKEQKRLEETWKALEVNLLERESILTRSKFANEQSELLSREIIDGNITLCNETKIGFGNIKTFIFSGIRTVTTMGEYRINYYIGNCLKASGIIVDDFGGFAYNIGKEVIVFLRNDEIVNGVLDIMDLFPEKKILSYKTNKKLLSNINFSSRDFLLDMTINHWDVIDHELDHVYMNIIKFGGEDRDSVKQQSLKWNEKHKELSAEITARYNYFKKLINFGKDLNEFWPNTDSGYVDIVNIYFPYFHDTKGETRKNLLKRLYQLRGELNKIQNKIYSKKSRVSINKGGETK